ncbi:hypothetical protein OIO90_001629 [Microbotryomycetes sp. JL221]|nr:hypothetical protein OIO90_001629 [Microbotryomycetes sp. JL221]
MSYRGDRGDVRPNGGPSHSVQGSSRYTGSAPAGRKLARYDDLDDDHDTRRTAPYNDRGYARDRDDDSRHGYGRARLYGDDNEDDNRRRAPPPPPRDHRRSRSPPPPPRRRSRSPPARRPRYDADDVDRDSRRRRDGRYDDRRGEGGKASHRDDDARRDGDRHRRHNRDDYDNDHEIRRHDKHDHIHSEPRARSTSAAPIEKAEDAADVDEQDIASLMGFGGFGTTSNKAHTETDMAGANRKVERTYRQYMNRLSRTTEKGGFNRPLDKIR